MKCIYWFNIGLYNVNSVLIYHLTVGGGDNINYHYPRSERYITGGIFEICRGSIAPEQGQLKLIIHNLPLLRELERVSP